ncbi:hypothetical protein NPIRD3C_1682 [Nitrosopumilus piranensis]|uniref:Uncharacterized protein n=1 Tax=Nitrosopumilus piranensis TaxID=1582439 RepID=A0A0C5BX92_9ARCH|nr:hypothetical protein NPIRD3C_1682 [Nitrosopumilus piranensis]
MWTSSNVFLEKQGSRNEGWNWDDFKRRSRIDCCRSRSDSRSLNIRSILYNRNYGSSNYNHHTNLVEDRVQKRTEKWKQRIRAKHRTKTRIISNKVLNSAKIFEKQQC